MEARRIAKRFRSAILRRGLLVLAMASQVALAGSVAENFGVHRQPVEVVATVNAQPALCAAVLSELKQEFDSGSPSVDVHAAIAGDAEGLAWQPGSC
jgi:hypothetical protein